LSASLHGRPPWQGALVVQLTKSRKLPETPLRVMFCPPATPCSTRSTTCVSGTGHQVSRGPRQVCGEARKAHSSVALARAAARPSKDCPKGQLAYPPGDPNVREEIKDSASLDPVPITRGGPTLEPAATATPSSTLLMLATLRTIGIRGGKQDAGFRAQRRHLVITIHPTKYGSGGGGM